MTKKAKKVPFDPKAFLATVDGDRTRRWNWWRGRAALVDFATRYNETWLVARHGYRTPVQVRADQCRLDPNAMANLKLAA